MQFTIEFIMPDLLIKHAVDVVADNAAVGIVKAIDILAQAGHPLPALHTLALVVKPTAAAGYMRDGAVISAQEAAPCATSA